METEDELFVLEGAEEGAAEGRATRTWDVVAEGALVVTTDVTGDCDADATLETATAEETGVALTLETTVT